MGFYGFRPYVPVAQRRLQALKEIDEAQEEGARRLAGRHRGPQDRARASGARPGATISSAIRTSRTGCRADEPMSATAR